MTSPVSTAAGSVYQAYQARCAASAAAKSAGSDDAGTANAAFSAAGANTQSDVAASGSTLNASLLGALLGMNGASSNPSARPNPGSTANSANSNSSATHHHHGISAYVTQLANAADSVVSAV